MVYIVFLTFIHVHIYSRTLKTPIIYRLYGEQKVVLDNGKFNNLCDKCINIDVY